MYCFTYIMYDTVYSINLQNLKMRLKRKLTLAFFIALAMLSFTAVAQTASTRQAFYAAMASGNAASMDKQMEATASVAGSDKMALQGALLMRKSGSQKTPGQKLSMFRQGNKLLETAISQDARNPEYRFLRLMIQENAPKIVGYSNNITDDVRVIKGGYKSLPEAVQKAILSYSKTSKVLNGLQ